MLQYLKQIDGLRELPTMIQWGSSLKILELGEAGTKFCPVCEKERAFKVILMYRIWGLWWFFNHVTWKKYMLVCGNCSNGWELDSRKIEDSIGTSHIPFMHKYGLWILIAFFALSFILSTITYGTPTP